MKWNQIQIKSHDLDLPITDILWSVTGDKDISYQESHVIITVDTHLGTNPENLSHFSNI